jgi:hypothetical protein
MKPLTLTVAALAGIGLGTSHARAEAAHVYPAVTPAVVTSAVHHPGNAALVGYQEVSHRRHGHPGRYYAPPARAYRYHRGPHRGHGAVIVHPRVYGPPTVVIPHRVHPPVYRHYYRYPHSGFYYQGRGFSFGFSF